MRLIAASILLAGLAMTGPAPASAAPVVPLGTVADSLVLDVAQGCGPGFRRNAYGRCRPGYMMRACPRGYHRNAAGLCRRN